MSPVAHIMLPGVLSSRGHTFFMELTAFREFTSLALLILVFFLFFSLGKTLVREELTELRIRYFFGATLGSLSIRVITFLLLSLVVPAVLPSALLAYQAQQQFAIPGIIILTFTLVVFLVCTLTTMRTIKRSIS